MEPCHACGASVSADAQWCGQCYALPTRAAPATSGYAAGSIMAPTRPVPTQALPVVLEKTRWRKTPTTFGPVGRVLATFGFVVPFLFLVVIAVLSGGIALGGAGVWGFVIMPWGLRDVWRAGQIPAAQSA
jgi:hypothetical protein